MSYTPNVPLPQQRISDTQAPINSNFLLLESKYGTSGDHYPWTNANPPEQNKHAKVTLPGLPTANKPGDVIPAPAAGNCAIFAKTNTSVTVPYLARDGLDATQPNNINTWTLMPIKAFANFSIAGGIITINDRYNVASITGGAASVTITLQNPMRTTTYGVIAMSSNFSHNQAVAYNPGALTTTVITVTPTSGNFNGETLTIILLES